MTERHEFGKPLPEEESPESFYAAKNPEEWVGREYVGERQRTRTVISGDDTVEYRVGLNELDELVADWIIRGPFGQAEEPARIELADAPGSVREEADELLAEHVPEAARGSDD
jgi:hypothetical protein